MGVGDPLEASFTLRGPIEAGTWHLVGDGILLRDVVDMRFDVIWKQGTDEHVIVAFDHRFMREPGNMEYKATAYEADGAGTAAASAAGDLLILRMTASGTIAGSVFVPNADGRFTRGRIPSIHFP